MKNLHEFHTSDYDKIIVMSKVYFDEIKDELIARGYEKEQILPVEIMLEKYYDEVYHIEYYEHKVGLEIGGPTVSFSNIYNRCARCDGLNFFEFVGIEALKVAELINGNLAILGKNSLNI